MVIGKVGAHISILISLQSSHFKLIQFLRESKWTKITDLLGFFTTLHICSFVLQALTSSLSPPLFLSSASLFGRPHSLTRSTAQYIPPKYHLFPFHSPFPLSLFFSLKHSSLLVLSHPTASVVSRRCMQLLRVFRNAPSKMTISSISSLEKNR